MADQTKYDTATQVAPEAPSRAGDGARMPAAERHESQSPASRVGTRWLIVGVLLVLAVAGFFGWRYLGTYEATDDAQVDGHVNAHQRACRGLRDRGQCER